MIAAEGEQKASRALREAAEVIAESPSALQVTVVVVVFLNDLFFYLFNHFCGMPLNKK